MRIRPRKWIRLLWAFLLCAVFCGNAMAQSTEVVDLTKTGSLTVRVQDGEGKPIPGGELKLYQVAKLTLPNGNMTYSLTNGFENSGVSLDSFLKTGSGAPELAKAMAKNLPKNAQASAGVPDAEGKVQYSGLTLGLYLVVQSAAADKYHALDPFLVTVPVQADGAWQYAVDATPKTGTAATIPTTAPTTVSTGVPATTRLPQTGQLRWPVPVLAGGGILFLIVGWILSRRQEQRNENNQ